MKIISTNIAKPTIVIKNGKEVQTGIYKKAINKSIYLGLTDVIGDAVMDRKHHGGIDKACYLYSADHYSYWKKQFPKLDWSWGMFGENLTVEGLNETEINIGDIFNIGTATVQVSEPRRPCSILGIRFGTQKMVKLFNNSTFSGIYVRVLKEGSVKTGDKLILQDKSQELSIKKIFSLFTLKEKENLELAKQALSIDTLSEDCKDSIKRRFKI